MVTPSNENLCHHFLASGFSRKRLKAGVGHSTRHAFHLGVGDKEDFGIIPRSSLLFHTVLEYTFQNKIQSLIPLSTQYSLAVLVRCSGRIATLIKLPARVRFSSPTPQPQYFPTDLLVSIKKLAKLSKSLEFTLEALSICGTKSSPSRTNFCEGSHNSRSSR